MFCCAEKPLHTPFGLDPYPIPAIHVARFVPSEVICAANSVVFEDEHADISHLNSPAADCNVICGIVVAKQNISPGGYCGVYFLSLSYKCQLCVLILIICMRHAGAAGAAPGHALDSVPTDAVVAPMIAYLPSVGFPSLLHLDRVLSAVFFCDIVLHTLLLSASRVFVFFAIRNPRQPLPYMHLFSSAFLHCFLAFPHIPVVYLPLLSRGVHNNQMPATLPSSPPFHSASVSVFPPHCPSYPFPLLPFPYPYRSGFSLTITNVARSACDSIS